MNNLSSEEFSKLLHGTNFSENSATVIGYGYVGKEYIRALRRLGVQHLRVCTRSPVPLEELRNSGIELHSGGFTSFRGRPQTDEIAILGNLTKDLAATARHMAELGYKRILIEKPVALRSSEIARLSADLCKTGVEVYVAYNRVAYPSLLELRARVAAEGGITSCTYTFTEMVKPDWPQKLILEELARWGVANSLHVMSMAHGLIGLPLESSCYRGGLGKYGWHTSGAQFVGAGISAQGIPFSYHADWGSASRWSVEIHTAKSSYRFCPLEELQLKTAPLAEWLKVPLVRFDEGVKAGFIEELAAVLKPELTQHIPLWTLAKTVALTEFGEKVFGYSRD